MSYGIKVSMPGKDVSSTNPLDFVMNSDYGTIKFLKWGAGSKTVGASTSATDTVSFSWSGGQPLVMIYAELTPGSGRWYAAPFGSISGEDTYFGTSLDTDCYVENTDFVIKIYNNTASEKTISYYYFVIGETGQ